MAIKISDISKRYGDKVVFDRLSLELRDSAVNCIFGPSGCGKSTLLSYIAGIAAPDSGTLEGLEGRSVACAFQEPRLLPWKSVADNVDFVLSREMPEQERAERVRRSLELVEMWESAALKPGELSGGMAQRVSLARALAADADILLLDEPFSAIDATLKWAIILRLKTLWAARGTTVVMVTHDEAEASALEAGIVRLIPAPGTHLATEPLR